MIIQDQPIFIQDLTLSIDHLLLRLYDFIEPRDNISKEFLMSSLY